MITFDNRGVGASSGRRRTRSWRWPRTPSPSSGRWASTRPTSSFSLGGMIAQLTARHQPELVRKLILNGTGPAGGAGIDKVRRTTNLHPPGTTDLQDPEQFLFFTATPTGRGRQAFLARLKERTPTGDNISAFLCRPAQGDQPLGPRARPTCPRSLSPHSSRTATATGWCPPSSPRPAPPPPRQRTRHLPRRRPRRGLPVPREVRPVALEFLAR